MKIILISLLAITCLAADKPKCSAKIQSQFWPTEANADRIVRAVAARQGKLEMCSAYGWKYRWQSVTMSIEQYRKIDKKNQKMLK